MTAFMFPPVDDSYETEPEPAPSKSSDRIRETLLSIQQSMREAKEEERRIAEARNRIITFRVPHDLLHRLDTVAEDAACTRGHMIRQIIAEYMWYVEECDVRFRGSILTVHPSKRKR